MVARKKHSKTISAESHSVGNAVYA